MYVNRFRLAFAALLFCNQMVAHADELLAGVLFAEPQQYSAVCYLFNAGTKKATIVDYSMTVEDGSGPYPLSYNSCGGSIPGSIAPGAICAIQMDMGNNHGAVACKIKISNSSEVVGELEIRDQDTHVISNVSLQKLKSTPLEKHSPEKH